MEEFNVTNTQAILPLSLYVFALAFGPVISGPLSETIGRYYLLPPRSSSRIALYSRALA